MKRNIIISAIAILCMALVSCTINVDGESFGGKTIKGDGNIVTRNFDVSAFDEISTSLSATVNFTISDEYTCTVNVDENIFDYLDIKVKDGELLMGKVKDQKNVNLRATEFVIDITAPSLEQINQAGSGTFNVFSKLEGEKLGVNLAGSGEIFIKETVTVGKAELNVAGSGDLVCNELIADNLDANVAGSGDMNVASGKVREASASVAGSGDCDLTCDIEDLDANVAGSGDIVARVSGKLNCSIVGSGDISYYGDPVVEVDKVGRGNVSRLGI